jgi:hypothetical protein
MNTGEVRFRSLHVVVPAKEVEAEFLTPENSVELGRVTVASVPDGRDDEGRLKFKVAFSFCSPRDMYNKKYGQFIAYQRLQKEHRDCIAEIIKSPEVPLINEIKKACLISAIKRNIHWIVDMGLTEKNFK